VTGETDASIIVTIMSLEKRTVAATIPPIGEAVDLEGYASVIFPAGTFDATQDVTISVTASPLIQDVFEAHAAGPRLPYEIRINTGGKAPGKDMWGIHIITVKPSAKGAKGRKYQGTPEIC